MKRRIVIRVLIGVVIALALWLLYDARHVKLRANGKMVAVVKLPNAFSFEEVEYPVYAGDTKLFNIRGDFFDEPICFYTFADGKRFLCVYGYDFSTLVFVVDLRSESQNLPRSSDWPPNDELQSGYFRVHMEKDASSVMIEGSNYVRLPSMVEVQESASNYDNISKLSFCSKTEILRALATNRTMNSCP